jgi:hypothetical protein
VCGLRHPLKTPVLATRRCPTALAASPGIRLAVTVTVLVTLACSDQPRTPVRNGASTWRISTEPEVVIGSEGDPRYEFSGVSGVALLPEGGVAVADGGSQEIRVYDASGTYLRSLGGTGDGPGEFRALGTIRNRGDSILAIGQAFRAPARFQIFDAEHGYLDGAVLRPAAEPRGVAPRAIVSPTALLVESGPGWRVMPPAPAAGTLVHDSVTLGLVQLAETQVVRWIGEFPNVVFYSYDLPPGGPVERTIATSTLCPSLVLGGTSDDRVWIGDAGTGTIAVYDTTGSRVMEFMFPVPSRSFDDAALREAREAALARVEDPDRTGWRASIEAMYSAELRPPTAPRFTGFTAGPDGEVWVRLYSELPDAAQQAVVLDRNGKDIARATIPAGLRLSAVSRDRIVGVRRDADGVEQISIHRLRR